MYEFLSGFIAMGCFVAASVFMRFWRKTDERLLLWFAVAFALLGLERILLVAGAQPEENRPLLYAVRFAAFVLILIAIWQKNRQGERQGKG